MKSPKHMMTYIISQELEEKDFQACKNEGKESGVLDHVRYIKRVYQKVLVEDNYIKEKWRGYFNKLLNEDFIRGS